MPTPKSFSGDWTIRWWGVAPVDEGTGLPADGFPIGGRLTVAETADDPNAAHLSWSYEKNRSGTMLLPFLQDKLDGENVTVDFGGESRVCKSVVIQEIGAKGDPFHFLVGLLSCPPTQGIGTGNAGAFVAQVEPKGSGGDGERPARKLPKPNLASRIWKALRG